VPKIDAKFDLGFFEGGFRVAFDGPGFSLVELELSQCFDSFCLAGIYPSGFVFPFALLGVLGFEHQRRV
jgi:hypothetical protein